MTAYLVIEIAAVVLSAVFAMLIALVYTISRSLDYYVRLADRCLAWIERHGGDADALICGATEEE